MALACFERASPALKEVLLKIYKTKRPVDIEYYLHEFGSVEYHVQVSASDSNCIYLSVSTPILYQDVLLSDGLPRYTKEMIKAICQEVIDIVEPPRDGYRLTLKISFSRIPHNKDVMKMITSIASIQGVILSSQLKDMLVNANSLDVSRGMYRPLKLVYHPRDPFFIIKQPEKITAVFPMRFKENTDVVIATAFFQEMMDVRSSRAFSKAPQCIWSPIPPPELRGETIEDLSTNGGFVSFDIHPYHVEGRMLEKTVWNILNFYAFVKFHIKCTRSFIQRRMRTRIHNLTEILYPVEKDKEVISKKKVQGIKSIKRLVSSSKSKVVKHKYTMIQKVKRLRSRLKIHWFSQIRNHCLKCTTFLPSKKRYERLD